jgi:hypothetical protein
MSAATVKKIGIVGGSGGVGQSLATGFIKAGYEVHFFSSITLFLFFLHQRYHLVIHLLLLFDRLRLVLATQLSLQSGVARTPRLSSDLTLMLLNLVYVFSHSFLPFMFLSFLSSYLYIFVIISFVCSVFSFLQHCIPSHCLALIVLVSYCLNHSHYHCLFTCSFSLLFILSMTILNCSNIFIILGCCGANNRLGRNTRSIEASWSCMFHDNRVKGRKGEASMGPFYPFLLSFHLPSLSPVSPSLSPHSLPHHQNRKT